MRNDDVPVELIVAAFTDEQGAARALEQLKQAKKEKLIGIRDAAVITRDANNTLHIKETGDMSGRKGAGVGALVGGAIGLLFPPAILGTAAVGAGIGALAARLRDAGFRDDELKDLGSSLKPGTSALVAVIEHTWVEEVERELAAEGAQMVRQAVKEDIAEQLEAGRDVAYAAVVDQGSLAVGRVVVESVGAEPTPASQNTEPAQASQSPEPSPVAQSPEPSPVAQSPEPTPVMPSAESAAPPQ